MQRGEEHLGELLVAHRPRRDAAAALLAGHAAGLVAVAGVAVGVAVAVDPAADRARSRRRRRCRTRAGAGGASPASRASTSRNASRSSSGMCSTARIASRFSVIDTGKPGRAQLVHEALEDVEHDAAPTPDGISSCCGHRVGSLRSARSPRVPGRGTRCRRAPCAPWRCRSGTSAARAASRRSPAGRSDVPEVEQRAGPVDRLRDRRRLLQVERADRAHDLRDLLGERARRSRARAPARSPSRARGRGSRCAGRGSGASAPRRARGCCST